MTDPFTLTSEIAQALNLSPLMTAGLLALVAAIIAFSIISLMVGKPVRAFRILATGFALIIFFVFSRVAGSVSGI